MARTAILKQQITRILDINKKKQMIKKMLKMILRKNNLLKNRIKIRKIIQTKVMLMQHLLNPFNLKPLKTEKFNKESPIYSKEVKLPKIINLLNPLLIASKS